MTIEELKQYKHSDKVRANYMTIPATVFDMNEEGMNLFNEIYEFCKQQKGWRPLTRTPSGGLSKKIKNLRQGYDVRKLSSSVELTICCLQGCWRFQFRTVPEWLDENGKVMYGAQAFKRFREVCSKHGIDLDDYKTSAAEGKEIKKTIPTYLIDCSFKFIGRITKHCYHVDFHQSFPAGLVNTHPEFSPVIGECYSLRKLKGMEIYKAVLDYTIGYMQKSDRPYWAQLSKDAITDNNNRVQKLARQLQKNNYIIVAYNTDGIWYYDMRNQGPYHGEGEGKGIGQWENDHFDCTIRFKSKGCYEYIEDGKYFPVVRGRTNLDRIKPRTEWEWGSIYTKEAQEIKYKFVEGTGIVRVKED